MDDLAFLDATAQAELVRRGELAPVDLVDAAISRIERVDPQVNSIVIRAFEQARAMAASPGPPEGPFRGVPITVKDLLPVAGMDRYCGFPFLKRLRWRETFDCHTVARLKAGGFIVVGKANCPDAGVTTERRTAPVATRGIWRIRSADPAADRPPACPRDWCRCPWGPTEAGRSAFPRASAESWD